MSNWIGGNAGFDTPSPGEHEAVSFGREYAAGPAPCECGHVQDEHEHGSGPCTVNYDADTGCECVAYEPQEETS